MESSSPSSMLIDQNGTVDGPDMDFKRQAKTRCGHPYLTVGLMQRIPSGFLSKLVKRTNMWLSSLDLLGFVDKIVCVILYMSEMISGGSCIFVFFADWACSSLTDEVSILDNFLPPVRCRKWLTLFQSEDSMRWSAGLADKTSLLRLPQLGFVDSSESIDLYSEIGGC
nr:hypothetical protein Iba_chr14cCG2570 [Ipomoea batatas]